MASLNKYREHRSWGAEPEVVEIEYDFAKDGGAVSALDVLKVKDASIVTLSMMNVDTACTSGGAATVSIGKSGDAAGLVAATAVASLTAGASIDGASIGSSYKLAANDVIQMDIAVAALTAGKLRIRMEISKF